MADGRRYSKRTNKLAAVWYWVTISLLSSLIRWKIPCLANRKSSCRQAKHGDVFDIYPHDGKITKHDSDEIISEFKLNSPTLLDEVRAGGRIPLIVGRGLTNRA